MTLLLKPASEPAEVWITALHRLLPDLEVRVWPDIGPPEAIAYALVVAPPHGLLASLPNLRLIISLVVGVDGLLNDPDLPSDVPLVRCVDPGGDPMMTETVVMHVLRHHRQLPAYLGQQRAAVWQPLPQPRAEDRRVGILGLGTFGRAAATAVRGFGFQVLGWARDPGPLEGIRTFGATERDDMLRQSDIVVSLLPETAATRGVLNADTLSLLPAGAAVVNLGRGSAIVEADLLAWLDSDPAASSTLDVTDVEPLPASSPLWQHPRVTITPHVAALVKAARSAPVVAENIRRLEEDRPLINKVNRTVGY